MDKISLREYMIGVSKKFNEYLASGETDERVVLVHRRDGEVYQFGFYKGGEGDLIDALDDFERSKDLNFEYRDVRVIIGSLWRGD